MLFGIPIVSLAVTLVCTIIGTALLIGGVIERPKPNWTTIDMGVALGCIAVSAAIYSYRDWLSVDTPAILRSAIYAKQITVFASVGIALFIIGFLIRLFPNGQFDGAWLDFILNSASDSTRRGRGSW